MQNVHTGLEKARSAARDAVARHAALIASAVAATEAAATAKRRLPEVDADKKAAAAARVCCMTAHCHIPGLLGCASLWW